MPDEVAHDLFIGRSLRSEEAVNRDVTDNLVFVKELYVIFVRQKFRHRPFLLFLLHCGGEFPGGAACPITYENKLNQSNMLCVLQKTAKNSILQLLTKALSPVGFLFFGLLLLLVFLAGILLVTRGGVACSL